MSDELIPCPFCGFADNRPSYYGENDGLDEFEEDWKVECESCGVSPMSDPEDKAGAIKAWNTRAPQADSDSVTISREILVDISETLDIGVARALARKALEANPMQVTGGQCE